MMHRRTVVTGLVLAILVSAVSVAGAFPERAVISGVPQYYQEDIDSELLPNPCGEGEGFPSGCGPVIGATVLAWWERRGVTGLMQGGTQSDGLPQDTIVELGTGTYMDRIAFCEGTAVEPYAFKRGLQAWFDDFSPVPFEVSKYKIRDDTTGNPEFIGDGSGDMDDLWDIVREEINAGRPMVYLLRIDDAMLADGVHYKVANHYPLVVGYDGTGGQRVLLLHVGWSGTNSYLDVHIDADYDPDVDDTPLTTDTIDLGERTGSGAAIKYNLYAIRPTEDVTPTGGDCDGWLVDDTQWHSDGGTDDGQGGRPFHPDDTQLIASSWPETTDLDAVDGACFVARWFDEDGDGLYSDQDNCPDIPNADQSDTDNDGFGDVCDLPDFTPSLGAVTVKGFNASLYMVTLSARIDNIGTDVGPPDAQLRWEGPGMYTPVGPCSTGPSGIVACAYDPLWSFYPNVVNETISTAGLPTMVSNSWLVERTSWDRAVDDCLPLHFSLTIDPADAVEELDEANNDLDVAVGGCGDSRFIDLIGHDLDRLTLPWDLRERLQGIRVEGIYDHPWVHIVGPEVPRVLRQILGWRDAVVAWPSGELQMSQDFAMVDVIRGVDGSQSQCNQRFDKARMKYKPGNGRLVFQGSFRLDDGLKSEAADSFKPVETGVKIEILDHSDNLLETITLPGGPFGANGAGWKSNRTGDVLTYIDKDKSSKIKKVQLKRKDRNDPSKLDVKVMTNDLQTGANNVLAGSISLRFRLLDDNPGHCSTTDFTTENDGFCASNRSGTVLICRQ